MADDVQSIPVYHVHGTYYEPGSRSGKRFSEVIPAQTAQAAINVAMIRVPGANWTHVSADYQGHQQFLFEEGS